MFHRSQLSTFVPEIVFGFALAAGTEFFSQHTFGNAGGTPNVYALQVASFLHAFSQAWTVPDEKKK